MKLGLFQTFPVLQETQKPSNLYRIIIIISPEASSRIPIQPCFRVYEEIYGFYLLRSYLLRRRYQQVAPRV